ncbi:Rv3654c family TadE-like protein [Sinomonas humi]|uniref:Rv3654c family TadE-like protein n=1 Tax=Sinomonas humi TaxID=1338436 RepID=UPI0018CFE3C9|nr:Rv3654c family TadE-like protein [Sinomonas humi]
MPRGDSAGRLGDSAAVRGRPAWPPESSGGRLGDSAAGRAVAAPGRRSSRPASGRTAIGGADRGAGTILALALALVAILGCSAAVLLSQTVIAAERAGRAADLAALAAADAERGLAPGETCAVAQEVARLNAARVVSCDVELPGAVVRVVVRGEEVMATGHVEGRARAGQPP